jgi:hypothetical protein
LCTGGGLEARLCGFKRSTIGINFAARAFELFVDFGKPAALRQPAGGARWSVRGRNETIPPPEIAFA